MENNQPNYYQIYTDIINIKFPEKTSLIEILKAQKKFTVLEIIDINNKIFNNNRKKELENNKFKAYHQKDIDCMLDFQEKNGLNNSQLAKHFKVSRNSITKWKKLKSLKKYIY